MADVYANITEADRVVQERLADVIEQRAGEPAYRELVEDYLSTIDFKPGTRALELGCGTGAVTRMLARLPAIGTVLGIDPSPVFIARARSLAQVPRDALPSKSPMAGRCRSGQTNSMRRSSIRP